MASKWDDEQDHGEGKAGGGGGGGSKKDDYGGGRSGGGGVGGGKKDDFDLDNCTGSILRMQAREQAMMNAAAKDGASHSR